MTDTLRVLQLGQPLHVARCLGKAPNTKLHVLALTGNPRVNVRFSRYVSTFHAYRGEDDEAIISTIYSIVERTKAEVVLPSFTLATRFVSAHQDVLSQFVAVPPSPAPDVIDMVSDKWLLANYLARHKLCYPPTVLCTADETFERDLRRLSFPVLLKPREDLTDGAGIRLFNGVKQLRVFLEENPEHLGRYIVQSLISGYDMGCNVLCQEGRILAFTIQRAYIPARRPYSPAAVIEFVEHEQVLDLVTRLVSALGWSGVANVDLRYDEDSEQVRVLEFNPRYWTSLLGSLSAGVNFPYLHCLAGVGVPFSRPAYFNKRFVVKETLNQLSVQRHRGEHERRLTLGDTAWRYDIADPLPNVVKLVRSTFKWVNKGAKNRYRTPHYSPARKNTDEDQRL